MARARSMRLSLLLSWRVDTLFAMISRHRLKGILLYIYVFYFSQRAFITHWEANPTAESRLQHFLFFLWERGKIEDFLMLFAAVVDQCIDNMCPFEKMVCIALCRKAHAAMNLDVGFGVFQ